MIGDSIRQLYSETGQVYSSSLHRVLSLMLIPFGFLMADANFLINGKDVSCASSCQADYSVVGVWLIIVPIGLLGLSWYHLRLKPALVKRRLRH